MSKKSQSPKSPIDQIIARARTLKPAARAEFLRHHSVAEISEIHGALVGEAKPKTPRPILEKRILHALATDTPPPAHLDQDMNILVAGHHEAIAAASAATASDVAEAKPLDEAVKESPAAAANAASWDAAMPEPGYTPPAGTADEAQDGEDHADGDADDEGGGEEAEGETDAPTATDGAPAKARGRDPRIPAVGTILKRLDRTGAERVRCTIVEDGVAYAGKTYRTLSGAAMAAAKDLGLASKTQDGFAFWQLKKAAGTGGAKKDTLAALEKAWTSYRARAEAAVRGADDADGKARLDAILNDHSTAIRTLTGAAVA